MGAYHMRQSDNREVVNKNENDFDLQKGKLQIPIWAVCRKSFKVHEQDLEKFRKGVD